MQILIAFVNQVFTPRLCFGLYDLNSSNFYWVYHEKLLDLYKGINGVNGLLVHGDKIFLTFQSYPAKMAVLNLEFDVVSQFVLPGIYDPHSFCFLGDSLICASTGTDELHEIKLDYQYNFVSSKIFWHHSGNKNQTDNHHVNSVVSQGDNIIITQFGKKIKGESSWKESKNGSLVNISTNELLMEDLQQPHTAFIDSRKELYVCESITGNIVSSSGTKCKIGGYPRGMAEHDNRLYVGSSGRRLRSRSLGTMNKTSFNESKCSIKILSMDNMLLQNSIDLSDYGTEIYDLEVVDLEIPKWMLSMNVFSLTANMLQEQIVKLERKVEKMRLKNRVMKFIK
jgi:hypothetical protein